mmetsp:Transcript_10597/g.14939  ORF Transcript_10597/g.14939 Transcript_10597/m.14939 type:complete len:291 (-) Transcript_10597:97-969(-)
MYWFWLNSWFLCTLLASLPGCTAVTVFPDAEHRAELDEYGRAGSIANERKRRRKLVEHQNGPVRLGPENFTNVVNTGVKNAFVMFCKTERSCGKFHEFWELGTEHRNSHKVTVGLVHCYVHSDWRSPCDESHHGDVHIKYWTHATGPTGEVYRDGRGLWLMDQFIQKKLWVVCSANRTDLCGEKEKAYLAKQRELPVEELQTELERLDSFDIAKMSWETAGWLSARVNILESLVVRKEKPVEPMKQLTKEEALARVEEVKQKAIRNREEEKRESYEALQSLKQRHRRTEL